jgi:DNA gyrase/topoisomerase IV subunit B
LSCDEVRKKIGEVKVEVSKKEESKGYFLDHWIGMALFTSIDEYDVKILERRLKNLELLETEKCYLNFK